MHFSHRPPAVLHTHHKERRLTGQIALACLNQEQPFACVPERGCSAGIVAPLKSRIFQCGRISPGRTPERRNLAGVASCPEGLGGNELKNTRFKCQSCNIVSPATTSFPPARIAVKLSNTLERARFGKFTTPQYQRVAVLHVPLHYFPFLDLKGFRYRRAKEKIR